MKSKIKDLLKLFFTMLYISAFTFGGGFVIINFMKRKFVDELHWIDEEEMLDITAMAQSAPGAIAVNSAVLVGWKVAGALGMIVSVIATILPPLVILSVVSLIYDKFASNQYVALVLQGMQAGVAAAILDVVFSLGSNILKKSEILNIVIFVLAFIATLFLRINVVYIILLAAAAGIAKEIISKRKERRSS